MADEFVKGLDELLAALKDLPGNIERGALRTAVEEMSVTVAAAVAQEAPRSEKPRTIAHKSGAVTYLPGFLRASVRAAKMRSRKGEVRGGVEAPYYARFVERGHSVRFGRKNPIVGHVPANAFMLRGFEKTKEWAWDLARRTLTEELTRRIARAQAKRLKTFLGG